jgi:sugar phosphate isomerase/epimerase
MNIARSFCLLALVSLSQYTVTSTPIPDDCKTGGFAIGAQAWTFKDYTVLEAIDKTAAAGGKVIEFFPGQKLSKEKSTVAFDHNAPPEVVAEVKAYLDKKGVRAVNYGVVGIPKDETGARKVFEFGKTLGVYAITTESVDALDTIEKLVKEYDIRVGIHNHPRQESNPDYKVWDPNYVLSVVKDRDGRIGSASDTGHWVRSGLDPVASLKVLKGRIVSVHLKDLNERKAKAHDVPYGTGASGIASVLTELKKQGFNGNISVEYEENWANNVTDVAQCIGFVRGFGAAK